MNNNTTTDRVLIVVDVQNCFIKGGSFGGHNTNLKNLELSIEQSKEIEMLKFRDHIIKIYQQKMKKFLKDL
jgi:nicotinamidase-related amidase